MTLTGIPLQEFGGLNLTDDPGEVGFQGAIDVANVDFDQPGRIRSRNGTEVLAVIPGTVGGGTLNPGFMLPLDLGPVEQLLAVAWNTSGFAINVFDQTFSVIAHTPAPALSINGTAFGTPTAERAYFPRTGGLTRWDGTVFTNVTWPTPFYVAVQKPDNRLVGANISAGIGGSNVQAGGSSVVFSKAGDPENLNANDYVYLTPGDGEVISGVCSWGDFLFVFKQTRFFVFYGNSTDATGNSVFNYRTVDAKVGCNAAGAASCVAAPEGVYFLDRTGVYLTTGEAPRKVSGQLDALFRADTLPFFGAAASVGDLTLSRLSYVRDRLFFHCWAGGSKYVTFVYYPDRGVWTAWTGPFGSSCGWAPTGIVNGTALVMLSYASGTAGTLIQNKLYTPTVGGGTDDGVPFATKYQSGFDGFYIPGLRSTRTYPSLTKTVRDTELAGSGTVSFGWATDYGTVTNSTPVVMSSPPATGRGWQRHAATGRSLSYVLSGAGAWTVNEVTPFLREVVGR